MDQQHQISNKSCVNCPRCNSTNTKFCYYNNYSLSQPRHFCKACKRYWTRGGTLRKVPVGGGCRKNNKRVIKTTLTTPSSTPLRPYSSNQLISQVATSTFSATTIQGASNNGVTPLLFTSYNNINDNPTNGLLFSRFNNTMVEYHSLQNVTPSSCASLNQVDQVVLERMFQFQTMQQQKNLLALQAMTTNHDDPRSNTSMYTTSHWPQNHLANMDG